jgi:hypothetical protein
MTTRISHQTIKRLILFCAIIFFIELTLGYFFPFVSFINSTWTTANKVFTIFSFLGLIYCTVLWLTKNKWVIISLGLLFLIFLVLVAWTEEHPIDTTTNPVDIATLREYGDGKKLIARKYLNAKTNATIEDTVLVKDILVFRQFYADIK